MVKGILFDMDGVLFNTERVSIRIIQEVLQERGLAMAEDILVRTCGANAASYKATMMDAYGPDFDFEAYNDEAHLRMAAELEQNIPKMTGVDELLNYLRENHYLIAIASSTRYKTIVHHLKTAGIEQYFDAIIGGDLVENSKPHPEIFTKAAAALGLMPNECVAIEDSVNGIHSASAAGCVTIMVPDLMPPTPELRALCAEVLPSLLEVPAFLASLKE